MANSIADTQRGVNPVIRSTTVSGLENFARTNGGEVVWNRGMRPASAAKIEVHCDLDTGAAEVYKLDGDGTLGTMTQVGRLA